MEDPLGMTLTRRGAIRLLTASALVPLVPGCARVPAGENTDSGPILTVSMTVAGAIQQTSTIVENPYNYYFVVLNLTDFSGDPGPVPVSVPGSVADNGFATGFPAIQDGLKDSPPQGFVACVLWCPAVTSTASGYRLYNVPADTSRPDGLADVNSLYFPTNFSAEDEPDTYVSPQSGASTLSFTLRLNRLPNYTRPQGPPAYLQVNFINTNSVQPNAGMKYWDALGPGQASASTNSYLGFTIAEGQSYNSADFTSNSLIYENPGGGDVMNWNSPNAVSDPTLDIVAWSASISNS